MCDSNAKPHHVYITRRIPESGVNLLQSKGYTIGQWDSDEPVPHSVLAEQLTSADALLCLLTDQVDRKLIESSGQNLKVISTLSVGYDHIDVQACRDRGIRLGNTPNVSSHPVAELTIALLLATSRRIVEAAAAAKDGSWGTWKPTWLCGTSLEDATVGIFGFGRIGQEVVRILDGFDVKRFVYCNMFDVPACREAERVTLDVLLAESDFIVICCDLNRDTRRLFRKENFAKMKNSAILINTSRGAVVDMDDLYEALSSGELRAAGLDVTDPEPLPLDHKLLTLPNCVILPHVGSATIRARSAMSELAAKNIIAALEGGDSMPGEVLPQ